MEIILVLMALGATPFGAAMLDKHTRNRFKKYAKAHIKVTPQRLTMAEALKIEPRNKDWKADTALQTLWQEAFNYWAIRDRESVTARVANRYAGFVEARDTLKLGLDDLEKEREEDNYYHYSDYEYYYKETARIKRRIGELEEEFQATLSKDEKIALLLIKAHGKEVYYGNDLIRLSSQKALPSLDFVALTAHTSK